MTNDEKLELLAQRVMEIVNHLNKTTKTDIELWQECVNALNELKRRVDSLEKTNAELIMMMGNQDGKDK